MESICNFVRSGRVMLSHSPFPVEPIITWLYVSKTSPWGSDFLPLSRDEIYSRDDAGEARRRASKEILPPWQPPAGRRWSDQPLAMPECDDEPRSIEVPMQLTAFMPATFSFLDEPRQKSWWPGSRPNWFSFMTKPFFELAQVLPATIGISSFGICEYIDYTNFVKTIFTNCIYCL